jgi:hypothetical protein
MCCLLLFQNSNGCTNVSQCYFIHVFPVLLENGESGSSPACSAELASMAMQLFKTQLGQHTISYRYTSSRARCNKAGQQFCATDIQARWRGTKQLIVRNVPSPLHTLFPDISPPPPPLPMVGVGSTRPTTSMHGNQLTN